MQQKVYHLVNSTSFAVSINIIILINAALIGVETFHTSTVVSAIQSLALSIFTLEIVLRFIGKKSTTEYFTNGWNIFDIFIVSICYIPEAWVANSAALSVFRIMRVFRILRLVKTFPELKIIVNVLLRSLKSLCYTFMLLLIFMYMYAVMGVILFRGGPAAANGVAVGPQSPDPYGTISEAFFTLFRVMTGEDWTDLRYNLLGGQVSGASDLIITAFHVSWMGLAAFLLINLVVGAVVNNYDQVMTEAKGDVELDVNLLYSKIDHLDRQLLHIKTVIKQNQEAENAETESQPFFRQSL